jgi:hypothetical protein
MISSQECRFVIRTRRGLRAFWAAPHKKGASV